MGKQDKRQRAQQKSYEAAQAKAEASQKFETRIKAIKSGEVDTVELKGEDAIQFFMNHSGFDCTRDQAEELVSIMEKNDNRLMTTKRKSPFVPEDQIEQEAVFDTDEGLFWAIGEALSDPETNVVMIETKKPKDGMCAFALGGPNKKSKVVIRLCCDNFERMERAREKYGYHFGLSHDEVGARITGIAA